MNRRSFNHSLFQGAVTVGATLGGTACTQTSGSSNADVPMQICGQDRVVQPLHLLAAQAGINFGASFDMVVTTDPLYANLYAKHCGILTTDNSMKFGGIRSIEHVANFSKPDALVEFGVRHKKLVHGHTLIWNEWMPGWTKALDKTGVSYWLNRHIDELVTRYVGTVQSWDVVNEPFWPGHGEKQGYRKGVWFNALGADYVPRAFTAAAAANPKAKLCLNEAFVEKDTPLGAYVRKALLKLVDELLQAGKKLDVIGLQCHLQADRAFSLSPLLDFIGELSKFPVEVRISELDIADGDLRKREGNAAADIYVAQLYGELTRGILNYKNVTGIICWQLADKYSWITKENKGKSPLPFDREMNANAAYFCIKEAFLNKIYDLRS